MKANPDGTDSPYEINISLFDALKGTVNGIDQWQIPRFLCSQTIMLALKGIPAIYLHSLIATPNDLCGVEKTGRTRSINRRKWDFNELGGLLQNPFTPNALVFKELRRLLKIRKQHKAFHPNASQMILELGDEFFAIQRRTEKHDSLTAISNLTEWPQHLCWSQLIGVTKAERCWDLITEQGINNEKEFMILQPYQTVWLTAKAFTKEA